MSGFSYNGIHCEDMGCTFIPDATANWYASPDIEISKDDVAWRDGNYYYYTRRKSRTFALNCYFENINMFGREKIRRWLDEKTQGWLIFDDRDYIRYKVHPSKYVNGKIYRQSEGYLLEDYYNGTFTVTFEAEDPYGWLTKLTDDNMLGTQHDNVCNLVRSDMMPAAPAATDTNFLIYNQGTVPCGCVIRIGGSAPDGLEIYNRTNGSRCVMRGLPTEGVLEIDSTKGLVSLVSQYGTEQGFAYHNHGYIILTPNDGVNFTVTADYTAGSTTATLYPDIPEDLTGQFLYLDGVWRKIMTMDEEGNVQLSAAPATSTVEAVHVGKMNDIVISGNNVA